MEQDKPRLLDDSRWEMFLELTNGAAAPCFQCGVCTAICPWGLVREETVSVRDLIRHAQLGFEQGRESLWLCTACGACEAQCPRGVPIAEVIRGLRYWLWKERSMLEGLSPMLWSVYWNNNPWFQPPSERMRWASNLDLQMFDPSQHTYLLYIGCTASYDRRAQNIARALVRILKAAGVPFGVLGEEEPCCGEAVLSVGHRPYFEELAGKTAHLLADRGVEKMLTVSPHCYDVFQNEYAALDSGLQPLHYTMLLKDLLEDGTLRLEHPFSERVTFQDPCFLGRRNGQYEAPRQVLGAIPDLEVVEMDHSREEALCCGGGGGRMWMETPASERFSDLRVHEAQEIAAGVIATACPYCIACLEDSLKAGNIQHIRVMDVAEILEQALLEEDA